MTRVAAAPAPVAHLGDRLWIAVAVLGPLLVLTAGNGPEMAAVLLVCAVATVLALGSRPVSSPVGRVASGWCGGTATPPHTSRIPDPVHHPVSPRAPGLV